jgi:hypothetical protein
MNAEGLSADERRAPSADEHRLTQMSPVHPWMSMFP